MKYTLKPTARFERDVKRAARRGYDMALLTDAIKQLANGETLQPKYRDHALKGEYADCRECHISGDWLLIYEIAQETRILYLARTGTHSDLLE